MHLHRKLWALVQKISLRNTATQLLLMLGLVFLLGDYLPPTAKSCLLTLSLGLKETLLMGLPVVIFSCLFNTLLANRVHAIRFVVILFIMVIVSNFASTFFGYFSSGWVLPHLDLANMNVNEAGKSIELLPLWQLSIDPWGMKSWYTNQNALTLGLLLGLILGFFPNQKIERAGKQLQEWVNVFLVKLFIPVLPLFVLGFILKLQHEGKFSMVFSTYAPILLLIMLSNIVYITTLYLIATKLNFKRFFKAVRNLIPAGITGFTTMSSMATLPFTLKGAEQNAGDDEKPVVQAVVPATVNIHLIGDSVGIVTLALAVMLAFGFDFPSFAQFWEFTKFFVLAKFSVATIPGGSILTMIPILEQTLGFTGDMIGFITATFILFDPVITASNVLGNGAFAMLFTRVCRLKQQALKEQVA